MKTLKFQLSLFLALLLIAGSYSLDSIVSNSVLSKIKERNLGIKNKNKSIIIESKKSIENKEQIKEEGFRFKSLITAISNLNSSSGSATKVKSSTTTKNLKNQAENKEKTLFNSRGKDDPSVLWTQLFTQERDGNCQKLNLKDDVKQLSIDEIRRGERIYKSDFKWVKKWGYGAVSYLIDYLDPQFFKDISNDFDKIYKELRKYSNQDNYFYEDVFDMKRLDPKGQITDLKKLNPNYEKEIYENSINMVQIDSAMTDWGWYRGTSNQAPKEFVINYDLNGDGRLNPRELILGIIVHHKSKNILCYNCLLLLKKKLAAIFSYFDCSGKRYLSAEDLWKYLPLIGRDDKRWNIFSISNENNIRTDCINDFIIKNGVTRPGYINSEEFVSGILLAYWDRQTDSVSVIKDDSRNLKRLRWDSTGTKDTAAFQYIQEKELAEKLAEEEAQREKNLLATFKQTKK